MQIDAWDVAVVGDIAYLVDDHRLQILDVSQPTAPTLLGSFTYPDVLGGSTSAVALLGTKAYLADTEEGLLVVDVADPMSPTRVGVITGPPGVGDITIDGSLAFVAAGKTGGLQVWDLSMPAAPSLLGNVDSPGEATRVAVTGSYAYLADGFSGLQVIDVSTPAMPSIVGNFAASGAAMAVAAIPGHVLVADGVRVKVVDVTTPSAPTLVGEYFGNIVSPGVAVSGNRAYLGSLYLEVLDLTDLTSPTLMGRVGLPEFLGWAVAKVGNYAYVADVQWGLMVVDVSDPASWPSTVLQPSGGAEHLIARGSTIVYTVFETVYVAEATASGQITTLGSHDGPTCTRDPCIDALDIDGSRVYVLYADGDPKGMQVLDLSDPANPTLLGDSTLFAGEDVVAVGELAYVATGGLDVVIVNVADPGNMVEAARLTATSDTYAVALDGAHLYVGTGTGLDIFNVTKPTEPTLVGNYLSASESALDVVVAAGIAFVAGGGGLMTVDVSSPSSPSLLGRADLPISAQQVTLSGSFAYVISLGHAVHAVDVSDPANPSLAGIYATDGIATGMAINGRHAYIAGSLIEVLELCGP